MNYHRIDYCDFGNTLDGVGVTLFVSGCKGHKNCKGCHNPETWEYNSGKPFGEKEKQDIFKALSDPYISVLTITGGDPLSPLNREPILELVKEVKEKFPNKIIWLYTGFIFNQVEKLEIMKYINVIVDGPFIEKKRNPVTCIAKGSENQRIIRLKDGKFDSLYE